LIAQRDANAEAQADAKGQVGSKEGQAAEETPSSDSSKQATAKQSPEEVSSPKPSRQQTRKPPELQSPSEYRATLSKPIIKALDLAKSQLTDVEIGSDVLETILKDGVKQSSILTQERRESAWLKQLLDCLES
jgi:hypothetical protein